MDKETEKKIVKACFLAGLRLYGVNEEWEKQYTLIKQTAKEFNVDLDEFKTIRSGSGFIWHWSWNFSQRFRYEKYSEQIDKQIENLWLTKHYEQGTETYNDIISQLTETINSFLFKFDGTGKDCGNFLDKNNWENEKCYLYFDMTIWIIEMDIRTIEELKTYICKKHNICES